MSLRNPTEAERKAMAGFATVAGEVAEGGRAAIAEGRAEGWRGKGGRPSVYTEGVAAVILARLADGDSLNEICAGAGFPSEGTVRGWVIDDREGFAARYARARTLQAHKHADDTIPLSDGKNLAPGEVYDASKVRNQIAARQWHAARMAPRTWGDRLALDVDDNPLAAVKPDDLAAELAAVERDLTAAWRRGAGSDTGAADAGVAGGDMAPGGPDLV